MKTVHLRFAGERLKAARTEAGMTQALLAGLAGVGELVVQRAENGSVEPRGATAAAFAQILDIDVAGLYVDAEKAA